MVPSVYSQCLFGDRKGVCPAGNEPYQLRLSISSTSKARKLSLSGCVCACVCTWNRTWLHCIEPLNSSVFLSVFGI